MYQLVQVYTYTFYRRHYTLLARARVNDNFAIPLYSTRYAHVKQGGDVRKSSDCLTKTNRTIPIHVYLNNKMYTSKYFVISLSRRLSREISALNI